jgi:hypothetical protein
MSLSLRSSEHVALNPPAITQMAHQETQTNKEAAMKLHKAHEDGAFFRAH